MELDGLGSCVESDLAAVGGTLDECGSAWFLLEGRKSEFVLVPLQQEMMAPSAPFIGSRIIVSGEPITLVRSE